jgi:large conductance mechanosensitive channel
VFKGFREFILRGNVIELATAVVIGTAFTSIVNGIVTGIFNPIIALVFDADSLASAGVLLRAPSSEGADDAVFLGWGLVISAVIQFLLIAIIIYFGVITPMNYFKKLSFAKRNDEPVGDKPAPPSEVELLAQIRDLLAAQRAASGSGAHAAIPAAAPDGATPAAPSPPH